MAGVSGLASFSCLMAFTELRATNALSMAGEEAVGDVTVQVQVPAGRVVGPHHSSSCLEQLERWASKSFYDSMLSVLCETAQLVVRCQGQRPAGRSGQD